MRPSSSSRAACSATTTGSPNRSMRPPKAIDATANHAQPMARPAMTSVSQCTPSKHASGGDGRGDAARAGGEEGLGVARASPADEERDGGECGGRGRRVSGGKDEPEKPVRRWMSGRARSTMSFVKLVASVWPTTTMVRKPIDGSRTCAHVLRDRGHERDCDHHVGAAEQTDVAQHVSRGGGRVLAAPARRAQVIAGEPGVVPDHFQHCPDRDCSGEQQRECDGQGQAGEPRGVDTRAQVRRQPGMRPGFVDDRGR